MRFAIFLVVLVACSSDPAKPDAPADHAVDAALDAPPDASRCPAPTVIPVATASEVTVINDLGSTLGIFDPSVVYPAGAPGGALAYTSAPDQHSLRTRVALSGDAGASWTYVGEPNVPEAISIASTDTAECPSGTCSGFLISEVSSIVFDPSDPNVNARWKLFAHRYLAEANNTLHYRIGTITIQTAPEPQGPWTAPAKLFGLDSPSAYTTTGVQYNASMFPATADCLVLTEPAALALPNQIELAMGCVYLDGSVPKIRIVLTRTENHGQFWTGIARMVDAGDADCLGGTTPGASINAANLFIAPDGFEYLAATSSDATGYHGCLVYKIDNIGTGHVERDPDGHTHPVRAIVPDTGQFSGACTWSEGGGGYQIDIGFLTTGRPFRIFRAGSTGP